MILLRSATGKLKLRTINMDKELERQVERALEYLEDACFIFGMRENSLYINKMREVQKTILTLKEKIDGK